MFGALVHVMRGMHKCVKREQKSSYLNILIFGSLGHAKQKFTYIVPSISPCSFPGYMSSNPIMVARSHTHHGEYLRIDGQHRLEAFKRAEMGPQITAIILPNDVTNVEMRHASALMNFQHTGTCETKFCYILKEYHFLKK